MTAEGATDVYQCSGLAIASDIPLSAPSLGSNLVEADVTVSLGSEVNPPFERPSADVVAELVVEDYLCYTICKVADGYVARLPWIADFVIDQDLSHVVCHPVASGRTEVIPIIVPGTITAFLLAMRGHCVLHGSAVDLGGRSLAFVGVSGQGKSTMAAIFCAAGAKLVTDDVLPLDFSTGKGGSPDAVFSVTSGQEIRLREKAVSLARRFREDAIRVTEDERHAVSPTSSPFERLPLSAIVLPRPDRERIDVVARRMGQGEASLELGRCERIEGWRTRDHLRRQFADVGRIVAAVPVFEVSVPWGPPFRDDLAREVIDACGLNEALPLLDSTDTEVQGVCGNGLGSQAAE